MVLFLVILFLLFVNFWNIKPFGYLSEDMQLLMIIAWQLYGCYKFRKRPKVLVKNKYKYLKWIIAGIILSMIPAYIFYGQPIIQSFITYRTQILLCTIVSLFVISPKLEELIRALYLFSILMLGASLLVQISHGLFVIREKTLERLEFINGRAQLSLVAGVEYVTIPLFYYLQKFKEKFSVNDFLKVLLLFFVIFVAQNRSALFPTIVFFIFTLFFIKSKYKPFIWVGVLLIGVFFLKSNLEVFSTLIEETTVDLNDADYNRNKAWTYFLYVFSPHWICYILGNGFLSSHYSVVMQSLMEIGIHNSDVGFIGYWNQFGIIPIIAIFCMYCIVFIDKYPYFMKLIVLFSVICGLTTIYYGQDVKILHLALFYYLFYYLKKNGQIISKI